MIRRRLLTLLPVSLVALLLFTGCAIKFTGGGWIVSASGVEGEKATFGFTFDGPAGRFQGSYHDEGLWNGEEVRLRGTGVVSFAGPDFDNNCMDATLSYESQNPRLRGSGELELTACDDGEPGPSAGDDIAIIVISGPYSGYSDGGDIMGGNLQAHE